MFDLATENTEFTEENFLILRSWILLSIIFYLVFSFLFSVIPVAVPDATLTPASMQSSVAFYSF